jgi:hypothetical protein
MFDGTKTLIGDIELQLTEEFISQVKELPQCGEPWFKNKIIKGKIWKYLLKNPERLVDWNKGIPTSAFKNK